MRPTGEDLQAICCSPIRSRHCSMQLISSHHSARLCRNSARSRPNRSSIAHWLRRQSYLTGDRSPLVLCIGKAPDWESAIEIKMLRLMADNAKPNDNMLMHILSPYAVHRSAVTDCPNLARVLQFFSAPRAHALCAAREDAMVLITPPFQWDPAIEAFEVLARRLVQLGQRETALE